MVNTCSNCGKGFQEGFSFCPNCGFPVGQPAMATPAAGGPMTFTPGAQQVYPMQWMPMPYYYRPPMGAKRMLTVAGGILIVIAASICLLMAIIYIVDLAYWWDDWEEQYDWTIASYGMLGIVAFSMGIVSAISCFRLRYFFIAILGETLVFVSGAIDLFYTVVFGIILIILSVLSLAFTFAGYSEFKAKSDQLTRPTGAHPQMPMGLPIAPGQPPTMHAQPVVAPQDALEAADEAWDQVAPYYRHGR